MRVKNNQAIEKKDILRKNNISVDLVAIAYDYENSDMIYFVSSDDGKEYGQFNNLNDAATRLYQIAA
jgi:hypothetical protein